MISHLVDGQDPIAHQLCLGGDKRGEHKTWAITQHQSVTDVQCLDEGGGVREKRGVRERRGAGEEG